VRAEGVSLNDKKLARFHDSADRCCEIIRLGDPG
jgi:hypothetical protein